MYIGYWCESQKERDYKEDQDVGLVLLHVIIPVAPTWSTGHPFHFIFLILDSW
jgi:hypothetical protein